MVWLSRVTVRVSVRIRVRFGFTKTKLILTVTLFTLLLGLDRYRAGARYPILSAAAAQIPIPILEMTSHIAWGMHMLHTLGPRKPRRIVVLFFALYKYSYLLTYLRCV